jgi:hypothetical protein
VTRWYQPPKREPDGTVRVLITDSWDGPGPCSSPLRALSDIATWGGECGRGFQTFKDANGTHISKGARKSYRGMASDGIK